jgi:hypothetical protein
MDRVSGSGMRASTPTVPNETILQDYRVVNLSPVQTLRPGVETGAELRLAALNIFDGIHQIRNGTGVSASAPQYGLRRTIPAGMTQCF